MAKIKLQAVVLNLLEELVESARRRIESCRAEIQRLEAAGESSA